MENVLVDFVYITVPLYLLFYFPLFSLVILKIWTIMAIFRFNLFRRSSLLSLSLGGNVMRANFPEYRWLCGRGERRGKMAANQQSKWRPISLSLPALSHTIVCLFTGGFSPSVGTLQADRIYLFPFTSYFLFISFFLCTVYLVLTFSCFPCPFCLSFFVSFVSLLVNFFLLFSKNVYFLPCTHVMFFLLWDLFFIFYPFLIYFLPEFIFTSMHFSFCFFVLILAHNFKLRNGVLLQVGAA